MKKINALKFVLPILGLSAIVSLVGAVGGTVAWYAYNSRALLSYSGTSVQSTTQLQIGIKSDVEVDFPESVEDLVQDVTYGGDTNHYYFMKAGAGGMPAAMINAYLSVKGYTTNILEPLSSYGYTTGGVFNLRNRPTTNKPNLVPTAAEISKYVEIPFVFRVLTSDLSGSTFVGDQDVFISGAEALAATAGDGNINESIRLYIDRSNGDNYIFNPNQDDGGATKVAGVLDLSDDEYFDYDNNVGSPTYGEEYIYGEYTFEEGYDKDMCLSTPLVETSGYEDINGSGVTTERTTFTARHYKGVKYFANLDHVIPATAEYLGKNDVFPTKNGEGLLESNYAVCTTAHDGNKLGEFNMKVYLEGWDFSVIDKELTHKFYLGLTFEINTVRQI